MGWRLYSNVIIGVVVMKMVVNKEAIFQVDYQC